MLRSRTILLLGCFVGSLAGYIISRYQQWTPAFYIGLSLGLLLGFLAVQAHNRLKRIGTDKPIEISLSDDSPEGQDKGPDKL